MPINSPPRPLGTMIAFGFPEVPLLADCQIAIQIGATLVEVLPNWPLRPDPATLKSALEHSNLKLWSAHAPWGATTIQAPRVDLAATDTKTRLDSIDEIKHALDWLALAQGRVLVIHPGGLSDPLDLAPRTHALELSLQSLTPHAQSRNLTLALENMPPGVHPGSQMHDLHQLVDQLNSPHLKLALDSGHAHLVGNLHPQTLAAGTLLATTHIHDNHSNQDLHLPPTHGQIPWHSLHAALNHIQYQGPIMLECIRALRNNPELINDQFFSTLAMLCNHQQSTQTK